MISATVGRRVLLIIVVAGFAAALIILTVVGRGGAVTDEAAGPVIARLLRLYVPLLALMASFYFSERGQSRRGRGTTPETFWLATAVVFAWSFLAPILILLTEKVEGAVRTLDMFEVFGDTLAVAAIGFYFARSASESPA